MQRLGLGFYVRHLYASSVRSSNVQFAALALEMFRPNGALVGRSVLPLGDATVTAAVLLADAGRVAWPGRLSVLRALRVTALADAGRACCCAWPAWAARRRSRRAAASTAYHFHVQLPTRTKRSVGLTSCGYCGRSTRSTSTPASLYSAVAATAGDEEEEDDRTE